MRTISLLSSDDKVVRTQITLTSKLKKLIEDKASLKGQSLSEYIRRALLISYLVDQDEKEERKQLADLVIGSVNLRRHPEWRSVEKIRKWVRNLRREWEKK